MKQIPPQKLLVDEKSEKHLIYIYIQGKNTTFLPIEIP